MERMGGYWLYGTVTLSLNHLICIRTTTRFLGVKISELPYDNPRRGLELID